MVDPFQRVEKDKRITEGILRLLDSYDYPAQMVTKSALVTEDRYIELLKKRKDNYFVQMTITTLDPKLASVMEPKAPPPEERLEALRTLSRAGLHTAVRINPLYPPSLYEVAGESYEDMIAAFAEAGAGTVIAGGLRIQSKTEAYGPCASAEFIKHGLTKDDRFANFAIKKVMEKKRGTYYINADTLLGQYRRLKSLCDQNGIAFTVCYDTDENADRQEFKDLWHSQEDCCNAYGNVPGFRVTFKQISSRIAR